MDITSRKGGRGDGSWAKPQLVADAELAAVAAGDELASGSLEAAERYLGLAERAPVPEGRQGQAQLLVGMVRLLQGRQRGDRPAVAEEAQRLQAAAEAPEAWTAFRCARGMTAGSGWPAT